MYSKQRSWRRCQCHLPHTGAGSPTAHQNQHDPKTGADVTSLITAQEASRQWERGTPVVVSEDGSPTSPQMGQSCWQRQHSTCALLELQLLPSQLLCCWDKPSQARTHWASSSHQASSQPQQTCHKLLACSHPAWPGAQSHWESGPTSHVLHEAWLRVWPEATHEPFAAASSFGSHNL